MIITIPSIAPQIYDNILSLSLLSIDKSDPDAAAYIAAVEGAGGTVSVTQRSAINTFYNTGKSDGWYSSLKRLYLPIWGVASANAICLRSLTSGSFVGGVTHGSGFVQGNGSTGYFNMGVSPSGVGMTLSQCGFGFLAKTAITGSKIPMGSRNALGQRMLFATDAASLNLESIVFNSLGLMGSNSTPFSSIWSYTYDADLSQMVLKVRRSAGVTSFGVKSPSGTVPTVNMYAMCQNNNGTPSNYCENEFGSFFMSLALSVTETDSFTLNLKNLWETCTGLTLP